MRLYCYLTIILISLLSCSKSEEKPSENKREYDVRRVRWGNSQKEVMTTESMKPSKTSPDQTSYFDTKVGKRNFGLSYYFENDSLYMVSYIYNNDEKVDEIDVLLAEQEFVKLLTEKYGKPSRQDTSVSDMRQTTWETDRTSINLNFANTSPGDFALQIEYTGKEWSKKAVKNLREEDSLSRQKMSNDF